MLPLIDKLITVSKNAGDAILDIYNSKNQDFGIDYKKDNSPLTKADKASNDIICNELKKISPDIPILSEEGRNIEYLERKGWNTFWLIDPLDGTKEFIKKNGEFTVNIALIKNGCPILGIVYAPALDITWYGSLELGSFIIKNNKKKPINVTIPKDDSTIKVVSSRSHSNNPKLGDFLQNITKYELVKMGSSIKICLVADGSAHFYPRFGPTMEWDTAAAHAVVKFAGGRILNLDTDEELTYNKKKPFKP
jgi:3'(2'), 5'-bisphosphate nucleotidase